jgi:hypothetical protein
MKIIDIIKNKDNTYPNDLTHYLKIVWMAPNATAPYHNIRHMLHVMWDTYNGYLYYKNEISPRTLRNMLVAALFHDYAHSGKSGNDSYNIETAIHYLTLFILEEDKPFLDEISEYIKATQFPHLVMELTLPGKILRDADVTYTLSDTWIQTVAFGLSEEIGISTESMLKGQETFLKSLHLETEWAQKEYGPKIEERIIEAKDMCDVIYIGTSIF